MSVRIALVILMGILASFDLVALGILWAIGMPASFRLDIMGISIPQDYAIIAILILFPISILEIFFISWLIDRERMWK